VPRERFCQQIECSVKESNFNVGYGDNIQRLQPKCESGANRGRVYNDPDVMERLMAVKKLCASEYCAVTIRGKDEEVRTLSARELTLSGQQTQT